jgi:Undecaprenyl-phosphate galactose phosphotransferase WbaP
VRKTLARTSWWGFPTLVCGNDSAALNVDQWLLNNRRLGLRPIGVIADPQALELDSQSSRYIGPWSQARSIAEQRHAYWAVLVEPEDAGHLRYGVTSTIEQYLGNIPNVFVISKLTGIPDHWNRHQLDEGLAGVVVEQHLQLPIPQLVKRGMDLAIATIASVFLVPLFAVLGVAIKLTSPGPVFYGHLRVGRGNSRFKAWKFRTMVANADAALLEHLARHPELQAEWERDHKLRSDPRVTRLGKWMRKWSIDELPQILNVFAGDMSIVGPRPIVEAEIPKYGEHFETFSSVLPGITGLWQVCGRNDTTYDERVQLDMYYVHHWSPWMDLYLLVRTVKTVLFTRGAY